jgi:hypothetical protein
VDHEPVLEEAVDVDNVKVTDRLLGGLPQELSLNEILLDTFFIGWLVAAVAEANLIVQAYLLCWRLLILALPPLLRVYLLSSSCRGSGGFLLFVGLDDERVGGRECGEFTLGRSVGTGSVNNA